MNTFRDLRSCTFSIAQRVVTGILNVGNANSLALSAPFIIDKHTDAPNVAFPVFAVSILSERMREKALRSHKEREYPGGATSQEAPY